MSTAASAPYGRGPRRQQRQRTARPAAVATQRGCAPGAWRWLRWFSPSINYQGLPDYACQSDFRAHFQIKKSST